MLSILFLFVALTSANALSFSTHDSAFDRILDDYLSEAALRSRKENSFDSVNDFLPQDSQVPQEYLSDGMNQEYIQGLVDALEPRDRFQGRLEDLFDPRDNLLSKEPSSSDVKSAPLLRDHEYLEHSPSLFGHQFMTGGAGEGTQKLKPDGSVNNFQVVKSDNVLPAYCNPPNPCPVGHTQEDGCLEEFENTAAFSREYQSNQECMCDSEHMFDCPGSTSENDLDTLARSITNNGLNEGVVDRFADSFTGKDNEHRVVAKKFFTKKERSEEDKKLEEFRRKHFAAREKKGAKGTSERASLAWLDQ